MTCSHRRRERNLKTPMSWKDEEKPVSLHGGRITHPPYAPPTTFLLTPVLPTVVKSLQRTACREEAYNFFLWDVCSMNFLIHLLGQISSEIYLTHKCFCVSRFLGRTPQFWEGLMRSVFRETDTGARREGNPITILFKRCYWYFFNEDSGSQKTWVTCPELQVGLSLPDSFHYTPAHPMSPMAYIF